MLESKSMPFISMTSVCKPKELVFITVVFVTIPLWIQSFTEGNTTTLEPSNTSIVPVDLSYIGYDGTWEQFCDPQEINKDFPLYPEQDLKNLRLVICILKVQNKMGREAMLVFSVYKYCSTVRSKLDGLMEKFLSILSMNDEDRRTILLVPGSPNDTSRCYEECWTVFNRRCVGDGNPCIKMFKTLISRACNVPWLTRADIGSCINKVCARKFIDDHIDWHIIHNSIPYNE